MKVSRLSLQLGVLVTVAMAITAGVLVGLQWVASSRAQHDHARQKAEILAESLEYGFDSLAEVGNVDAIRRLVVNISLVPDVHEILVITGDGEVIASGTHGSAGKPWKPAVRERYEALLHQALAGQVHRDAIGSTADERELLIVHPLSNAHLGEGAAVLMAIESYGSDAIQERFVVEMIVISLLAVLAALLVLYWLIRRFVLKPLQDVRRAAERLDKDRFVLPKDLPRNEIGDLGLSLQEAISNWQQARQHNDDLNRRLTMAVTFAQIGIWEYDIREGRLEWSDEMFPLYGVEQSTWDYRLDNFLDALVDEDRAKVWDQFEHAVACKELFDAVFRIKRANDGAVRWIRSFGRVVVDEDDRLLRVVGTNWDVTEEREREEDLRQAKDMAEVAARRKAEFLATMSHELRTPLNSILGFSKRLERRYAGSLGAAGLDAVERVCRNGEHLLELINEILDLAKVDAGRMSLSLQQVNAGEICEEVIAALEPLASQKKLRICSDLAADVHPRVDALRLRQIVTNLLSNAIKYTDEGHVDVRLHREGEQLVLIVSDTGIGIRQQDLARLFQRFEQLDAGIERRAGGTGLGLAVTEALVELHEGRVTVTSVPGEGSTFTVRLPMAGPGSVTGKSAMGLAEAG